MNVSKEYNWQSLGTGTYTDAFVSKSSNHGAVTYPVEILKAEDLERYRVIEPYTETLKNDDGEWGNWIAPTRCPYVEFVTVDGGAIEFEPFFSGLYYQGNCSAKMYAYPR